MHLNGDVVQGEMGGQIVRVCVRVPPAMTCQGDKSRDSEHLLSPSHVASLCHTHTHPHLYRKHFLQDACAHTYTHTQALHFHALRSESVTKAATKDHIATNLAVLSVAVVLDM